MYLRVFLSINFHKIIIEYTAYFKDWLLGKRRTPDGAFRGRRSWWFETTFQKSHNRTYNEVALSFNSGTNHSKYKLQLEIQIFQRHSHFQIELLCLATRATRIRRRGGSAPQGHVNSPVSKPDWGCPGILLQSNITVYLGVQWYKSVSLTKQDI